MEGGSTAPGTKRRRFLNNTLAVGPDTGRQTKRRRGWRLRCRRSTCNWRRGIWGLFCGMLRVQCWLFSEVFCMKEKWEKIFMFLSCRKLQGVISGGVGISRRERYHVGPPTIHVPQASPEEQVSDSWRLHEPTCNIARYPVTADSVLPSLRSVPGSSIFDTFWRLHILRWPGRFLRPQSTEHQARYDMPFCVTGS